MNQYTRRDMEFDLGEKLDDAMEAWMDKYAIELDREATAQTGMAPDFETENEWKTARNQVIHQMWIKATTKEE